MLKLKTLFCSKPVIIFRPTRHDKRAYVVTVNGDEVPVPKFIEEQAKRLNALFPSKSVREYYQPIYRAHMKNGPAEAHKVIKQLILSARLDTYPKWWQKAIYYCYFYVKAWHKSLKKWLETFRKKAK